MCSERSEHYVIVRSLKAVQAKTNPNRYCGVFLESAGHVLIPYCYRQKYKRNEKLNLNWFFN